MLAKKPALDMKFNMNQLLLIWLSSTIIYFIISYYQNFSIILIILGDEKSCLLYNFQLKISLIPKYRILYVSAFLEFFAHYIKYFFYFNIGFPLSVVLLFQNTNVTIYVWPQAALQCCFKFHKNPQVLRLVLYLFSL